MVKYYLLKPEPFNRSRSKFEQIIYERSLLTRNVYVRVVTGNFFLSLQWYDYDDSDKMLGECFV